MKESHMKSLGDIQSDITDWAVRKGWMNPDQPRSVELLLTLINTEMSEMFEAIRKGTHNEPCDKDCGLTQFEEEMADIAIRVIQMAGEYKIDLADVIERKMAYNEKRPYMHGKKL